MKTEMTISQAKLSTWAQIIKDCKESGLKVNEYCKQHDITKDTYYYWYGKVKKEFFVQSGFVEITPEDKISPSQPEARNTQVSTACMEIKGLNFAISLPLTVAPEVLSGILKAVSHAQ